MLTPGDEARIEKAMRGCIGPLQFRAAARCLVSETRDQCQAEIELLRRTDEDLRDTNVSLRRQYEAALKKSPE